MRVGNPYTTHCGIAFYPLDPRVEEIDTLDIAHALAMKCRFGGHCDKFYSVAQHSVLVSWIVPDEDRLWALLHDAAEAYVSDVPRPVKRMVPIFSEMEDKILKVVAEKYGLSWPMPASVKHADNVLLVTEKRDLMTRSKARWEVDSIAPLTEPIKPWSPEQARQIFLDQLVQISNTTPARAA
jgi:5'-deoxynucleotidase YfbR-like HD superfamily hydrolase